MRAKILIIISIAVIVSCLICLVFPWCILWMGLWLEPSPGKPMYTYEEFPFELQYEVNGEIKTINDSIICEYKGVSINESSGKTRKWELRISSCNDDKIELLKIDDFNKIYYSPGPAEYYMGDYNAEYKYEFPNARYVKKNDYNSGFKDGIVNANELYQVYSIKLLKWEVAPPIKNNFNQ